MKREKKATAKATVTATKKVSREKLWKALGAIIRARTGQGGTEPVGEIARVANLFYERFARHHPALVKRLLQIVDPKNSAGRMIGLDWLHIISCPGVLKGLCVAGGGMRQIILTHGSKIGPPKETKSKGVLVFNPASIKKFEQFSKDGAQFFELGCGTAIISSADKEITAFVSRQIDVGGNTKVEEHFYSPSDERLAWALWAGMTSKKRRKQNRDAAWGFVYDVVDNFISQEIAELAKEQ